jgi:effector-binding domain-containing protein
MTLHRGTYQTIGLAYARLLDRMLSAGLRARLPIQELYLRGPGMLVPRSPRRYLTEIRLAVQ